MAITKPSEAYWDEKVEASEKVWLAVSILACLFMFLVMVVWAIAGKQNPPQESYRIRPSTFQQRVEEFINKYKIGEENGVPIVEAPSNVDLYLMGRMFQWTPILVLKKGETYRIRLSSIDVNHGFSIQPVNINFQAVPGYEYVLTLKPTQSGEFLIVCNEFCGIGHHKMVGKIIVK
jgi:Heme/copper-type cytochrome/quinol oxidases, subunit 2